MMQARWIIQDLENVDDVRLIAEACENLHLDYSLVSIPPFSSSLPDVPDDRVTMFWGSVIFISNAAASRRWVPCAFYPSRRFHVSSWTREYGRFALNHDATFTTLSGLYELGLPQDHEFFLRPDADTKSFSGMVTTVHQFEKWEKCEVDRPGCRFGKDTAAVLASRKSITREWRVFVVGTEICSCCLYRENGVPCEKRESPQSVRRFAEKRMKEYTPAYCYVMDIAESEGSLYVLELNCLNSSGFYACDVQAVVSMATDFATQKYQSACLGA